MKKIVAIIMVVVLMTAIAACLAEHMVKVEREYSYKYGEETIFNYVSVQVRETVRNLKGDEISNCEYEIFKKTNELPWYNVWSENAVEFR